MCKKALNDLALFSGPKAFEKPLHVGRPNVGDRDKLLARIEDMLDRRWLTNDGPFVRELEQNIEDYLGVKHCVAMCNGTVALEIACRALGMSGEVIVPSFTFVATAHALQWQDITPVFCDLAPGSHHMDPVQVAELITPRTSGIIGVHVWGEACDIEGLTEIATSRNLRLVFDAAHAFACSHNRRMIGGFGDVEVFSFHATKFFNTFEGGAITTDSDELAEKTRLMRNFGFSGYDLVCHLGINGKMTEIAAAMGLVLLEGIDTLVDANQRNYRHYRDRLAEIAGITLHEYDEGEQLNYQYIVAEIDDEITRISRDDVICALHAENVLARRYFFPGCHEMEPYRSISPGAGSRLVNTNRLVRRVMQLPTGSTISEEDVSQVCDLLQFVLANGQEIASRMAAEA